VMNHLIKLFQGTTFRTMKIVDDINNIKSIILHLVRILREITDSLK
jgi:hypothetical protein